MIPAMICKITSARTFDKHNNARNGKDPEVGKGLGKNWAALEHDPTTGATRQEQQNLW